MQNILFLDNLIHNSLNKHNMNQSIMCKQLKLYIYRSVLRMLFLSKINQKLIKIDIYIYILLKSIFLNVLIKYQGMNSVSKQYLQNIHLGKMTSNFLGIDNMKQNIRYRQLNLYIYRSILRMLYL